ncbi:MAG: hypothetical protein AAGN82_21385 [Myxococcota bacterium]
MPKTVIVSDETIRLLLEAHASMAAWYYQLAEAVQRAGVGVTPPTDEGRRAHLAQVGRHFPELAATATAIEHPRPYIPPPVLAAPPAVSDDPALAAARPSTMSAPPGVPSSTPPEEEPTVDATAPARDPSAPTSEPLRGPPLEPPLEPPLGPSAGPPTSPSAPPAVAPGSPSDARDIPAPPAIVDPSTVKYE